MPHLAQEAHRWRVQRVVPGELELGWEDAALEGRAVGPLDQGFPEEDVVLGDGSGRDAVRRGGGEELVLVEEAAGCDRGCHCCLFLVVRFLSVAERRCGGEGLVGSYV